MKLADKIRDRKQILKEQEQRIEAERHVKIKTIWDQAVRNATSTEMVEKIFDAAEKWRSGKFRFDVMDSRSIPNRKGGSHYDIPLSGAGNLYCAMNRGLVKEEDLFEWYPPFAKVAEFYQAEGFKTRVYEDGDGAGMCSWLVLEISLEDVIQLKKV